MGLGWAGRSLWPGAAVCEMQELLCAAGAGTTEGFSGLQRAPGHLRSGGICSTGC